jgi:hypothetical protein
MKQLIFFVIILAALPCMAQWKTDEVDDQIIAFGVHDSMFFISMPPPPIGFFPASVARLASPATPMAWVEADSGIDFTQGNVTLFTSLGRYLFVDLPYRTSNDGKSWQEKGGVLGVCDKYLITSSQTSIYRSGDSGNSWQGVPGPGAKSIASIGITVFANTGSNLWRSKDTGNNWSQLSPQFVGAMMTMGSLLFITGANGSVIVSSDNGDNWNSVAVDSAVMPLNVNVLVTDGKNLFAGTTKGVYLSTDTGKNWRAENDGLGNLLNVNSLGIFDTLIFVNVPTNTGGYYTAFRPIHEMTDTAPASVVQTLPLKDSIEVYPNPAAGIVTLLSGGTSILGVNVLNVLGEEILTSSYGRESEINLDISKLASGTYFLRIQTSLRIVLRKIVKEE